MGINVKIKDIDYTFKCKETDNWKDLVYDVPILKEVFREISCGEDDSVYSKIPAGYIIKHSDKKLRKLMSEIDKYRNGLSFKGDAIYNLAGNIKDLIRVAMSKKKDLEVKCLWR